LIVIVVARECPAHRPDGGIAGAGAGAGRPRLP